MNQRNLKHIASIAFVMGSLLVTPTAFAENADRQKPIEIVADEGSLDQSKQETVFTGNVEVVQGTLKMTAARVQVNRLADGSQTMRATGSPVHFKQKLEGKSEWVKGQGNTVTYDSGSGQVVLTGNARVEREGDVVIGDVITYNTHTEIYNAKKGATKGRVSVVLQPSSAGGKK